MFSTFCQSCTKLLINKAFYLNAIYQKNNTLSAFGIKKFFTKLSNVKKNLSIKSEITNENKSDEINLTHRFICDKIRLSINFFLHCFFI